MDSVYAEGRGIADFGGASAEFSDFVS